MKDLMKEAAGLLLTLTVMVGGIYSAWWDIARAAEIEEGLIQPVWITGYCIKGQTASGEETRAGICAYRPRDIGKTAMVYDADMKLIGIYEVKDTGGQNIRSGTTLDIWFPTKEECHAITQKGYVVIVDADG